MIASNNAAERTTDRFDMSVRYDISIPVIIAVRRLLVFLLCLPAIAHEAGLRFTLDDVAFY